MKIRYPILLFLVDTTVQGFAPCTVSPHRSAGSVLIAGSASIDGDGERDKDHSSVDREIPVDDDLKMSEEERKKYDQIANHFLNNVEEEEFPDFPSALPQKNPFSSSLNKAREDGGSMYSDTELMSVLNLHKELSENDEDEGTALIDNSNSPLGGIHDLITSNLGIPKQESKNSGPNFDISASPFTNTNVEIDEELKYKMKRIRAIASDVDGTILTKKQTVHPRTRLAICKAIKLASSSNDIADDDTSDSGKSNSIDYFFPATGKSRRGALDSLGIEIGNLIDQKCPGVYLQGLFCVDSNGEVVFEKKLEISAIAATEELVKEYGISIVAYDGDNLYTTEQTDIVVHLNEHYGEPLPVTLPNDNNDETPVRFLSSHEPSMHKLLLMDDDVEKLTNVIRPRLETLAKNHGACVTQALPTMLELLPEGCSKQMGVMKLCEKLRIDPETELLALGDAENDAGMLEMAAVGVAVGNATPPAKKASDYIVEFTNDEGGAGFAMELFALNK